MPQLSELLPGVLPEVPKCSQLLAEDHIRSAVEKFFKDTKVHNSDLAPISTVIDTHTYALPNPVGWQIMHVRWAELDGRRLASTSEEQLDLVWDDYNDPWFRAVFSDSPNIDRATSWRATKNDRARAFYCANPNTLRLVGIPQTAVVNGLVVNVVSHPTPDVSQLEDWLFNTHHETIEILAISTLKALANQPFSNASQAAFYLADYEQRAGTLEDAVLRGYQRNDQPVRRTRTWAK